MADLDYDGFGPDMADETYFANYAGQAVRWINLLGAVMSLTLLAGLGVWGYQLAMRDVTGVPVVVAIDGPMRVQPEDPGGERAAHQGLAVNRIAAVGDAAPPPDQIVLAPRSADLLAEDMAQGVLRATPALAPAPAPARPTDPLEAAILAAATGVLTAEAELSGDGLIQIVSASVPGPVRSLRPRLRPDGFATATVASAPADTSPATEEIDPASLAPGARLVQFGAYDSPEEARAAWAALGAKFDALMDGKGRVIEEAESGGRPFYRLRAAGFKDLADARRFCAAFVAERTDCIPVIAR